MSFLNYLLPCLFLYSMFVELGVGPDQHLADLRDKATRYSVHTNTHKTNCNDKVIFLLKDVICGRGRIPLAK